MIIGFLVGGALATSVAGVAALWSAVLAGLGWLVIASVRAYGTVPHPDVDRRRLPDAVPLPSRDRALTARDRCGSIVGAGQLSGLRLRPTNHMLL